MKGLVVAGALALGAGCSADYAGLEILPDGRIREGTSVQTVPLVLPVGHVARIEARPRSATAETYDDPDEVELAPADPNVFRVLTDEEEWRWALVGASVGESCLEVRIRGALEDCIDLIVMGAP